MSFLLQTTLNYTEYLQMLRKIPGNEQLKGKFKLLVVIKKVDSGAYPIELSTFI